MFKAFIFTIFYIAISGPLYSATTSIIFIRHAEKGQGTNPELTPAGHERARSLISLASVFDISAIYSSNYTRTRSTAKPLADHLGIKTNYSISPIDFSALKIDILDQYRGKTILVVGHSNTVPGLINFIQNDTTVELIDEKNFSNLFILHYDDITSRSVLHRYKYILKENDRLSLLPVSLLD